ncbi:hypothetical protein [Flagellimonas sp.]|uniref:hypothetical protein n=1 Tax=Flagellimonas sp. TaxID=2058762 RepID=UPI003AB5AFB3
MFPVLFGFFLILLTYLCYIIYTIISGAFIVPVLSFGILLFLFFTVSYFLFRKQIKGLARFLLFLFISIWVYPTLTYYLFLNNPKNYNITNSFFENEISLIHEKNERKIPLDELKKIREHLDKEFVGRGPKFIEIPEKYNFDYRLVGWNGRWSLTISKHDSAETELSFVGPPDIFKPLILDALDKEIESSELLVNFSPTKAKNLPYSEFWVESIFAFQFGDITPGRNTTKFLNIIPIICSYFMLIILNSNYHRIKKKLKKRRK